VRLRFSDTNSEINLHETWNAQQAAHNQLQGTIITVLERKEVAIYMEICKWTIHTAMAIVNLPLSRNITPITCRQVYWLYHKDSFVYTPVLSPTISACLKIAGLPSSTKL
jgi:G:T-mismatch repair DNA endonuclease (very short patch repair protein)